jgi:hypothetical protein
MRSRHFKLTIDYLRMKLLQWNPNLTGVLERAPYPQVLAMYKDYQSRVIKQMALAAGLNPDNYGR